MSNAFHNYAQNVHFEWVKRAGGFESESSNAIATDASGNVYTTGFFNGAVDFDPGPAIHSLTSLAENNMFVSKSDPDGNFIWVKQITGYTYANAIALDNAGNIFITGQFNETTDFDPGTGVFNLTASGAAEYDIFITKLDAEGNFLWATKIGDIYGDAGLDIAVDAAGNVYTIGVFTGTADFDPGPNVYNLTGSYFLTKLNGAGNFIWAKVIGGIADVIGQSLALDVSGNIFTTGAFSGITDFDPGPNVVNLNSGNGYDIFISKLDSSGNFKWVKQFTGDGYRYSKSIGLDGAGNIYATGLFSNTVDFDPGTGLYNLTAVGGKDIFISKLDNSGNFIWAKRMGGLGNESALDMIVDQQGNTYATGVFENTADFDPGIATFNLSSMGQFDAFITRLDAAGSFVWAKQISGSGDEISTSIAKDNAGNIYTSGNFVLTSDFDPGIGVFNMTSAGVNDIFIQKMSPCISSATYNLSVTSCNSYTLNNQTYNSSGTYTQLVANGQNCDSMIILNLTINASSATTLPIHACNSYNWNGHTYYASGIYRDTLTGPAGCDSILILNLTIANESFTNINAVICEGNNYAGHTLAGVYVDTLLSSGGCDSVRTLTLSVIPKIRTTVSVAICEGNNYLGHTVTGIYSDVLFAAGGCDSVVTTDLLVHPKPVSKLGPDRKLCSSDPLTISPGSFSSYTWQDLTTAPNFVVTGSGTYWVIVKDNNNCSTTDSISVLYKTCYPFSVPNAFTPNKDRTNDLFKPTFTEDLTDYSFVIFNRYGLKVFETRAFESGWDGTYKGMEQSAGSYIYYINYKNDMGQQTVKKGTFLLLR